MGGIPHNSTVKSEELQEMSIKTATFPLCQKKECEQFEQFGITWDARWGFVTTPISDNIHLDHCLLGDFV
jgi:hypothetical protein